MKFLFQITDVNRDFLIKYPYAALDGNLTILIKDKVFFDKQGISLLGFALCVSQWLREMISGSLPDFDYSSDEYVDNPVLHLTKVDNQHYALHSAWVEDEADAALALADIIHCFNTFLRELDTTIKQEYGVGFTDIPLFNLIAKPKEIPVTKPKILF